MLRRLSSVRIVGLIALLAIGGCASHKTSTANPDANGNPKWREALPAPVIDSAEYTGAAGNERNTVRITGGYFDLRGDSPSDVLTSLDLRRWVPAKKIRKASGTLYVADVAQSAGFEHVYVRIYGENGYYSQPMLIQK